jgi:phage/plasmid-like protein (TIGR03299 family)
MSANILGERFYGLRVPAWHNLGFVSEVEMTASEALQKIDADYRIEKCPLTTSINTLFGTINMEIPDKVALVREPIDDEATPKVLGFASKDYEIVQNVDFARALDKLADKWPVETVGVLGQGETIFFVLNAGESVEVAGEEIKQYFLVTDTVDGKTSQKFAFTPIRTVCQNTLHAALSASTVQAGLSHRKGFTMDFEFRVDLVDKLLKARNTTLDLFERMADSILSVTEIDEIIERVYPYPAKPKRLQSSAALFNTEFTDTLEQDLVDALMDKVEASQYSYEFYIRRADKMRDAVKEIFGKFNDEQPKLANTGWALYNSIVEFADFREGKDTADFSAVFGTRAKEKIKAFDYIMAKV